jgi:hypothetical protein
MSTDRTVLEHLLDGREALVLEVDRLTTAIEELDAVIGRVGGTAQFAGTLPDASARSATGRRDGTAVNSGRAGRAPAEVESGKRSARSRPRSAAKRSAAKRSPGKAGTGNEPPKSIRIRVLEMLEAEDREFGLTEIIERIRVAGIRAHDDAVRSITVKLMKDGKVERVGRGQYRLSRRGPVSGAAMWATTSPAAELADGSVRTAAETTGPVGFTPSLNLSQPWESPRG